jgi:hypothetical protein
VCMSVCLFVCLFVVSECVCAGFCALVSQPHTMWVFSLDFAVLLSNLACITVQHNHWYKHTSASFEANGRFCIPVQFRKGITM